MKHLYQIFQDPIETLLLSEMTSSSKTDYIKNSKSKKENTRLQNRIFLVRYYQENNLLSDEDQEIVELRLFDKIIKENGYEEGIQILNNYLNNDLFAIEYLEQIIQLDDDYYEDVTDTEKFLSRLEKKHDRKFVIDLLLQMKTQNKLSNFTQHLTILKYIGNVNQFRQHLKMWLDKYYETKFDRGMDVYSTGKDYINQIVKYFGHLPECEEMYLKIQFLYDNFDTYTQLYEDDAGNEFLEDIFEIFKIQRVMCDGGCPVTTIFP